MANRSTKIVFPVFNGFEVRVISARSVERTGKRLNEDLTGAEAGLVYKEDRPGTCWIILGPKVTHGEIAHESTHAVQELCKFAGISHDNETVAYHVEFLVSRIHKFLKR